MSTHRREDLMRRVRAMRVDSRHGRRSPHKPLLLLLSIGRYIGGHERLASFEDVERDLNGLIRRFGLPGSRENAYQPFWRLRSDGLWQIDRPEEVRVTASDDAYVTDLRERRIRGGLTEDVIDALERWPSLIPRVISTLLDDYFPPSMHEDILGSVGLAARARLGYMTDASSAYERRDRSFREVVLRAYDSRCAVCELDVRMDDQPVGIEAAHIKWHSAGGQGRVANGMALCVLHHKFFDSGLFTVASDLTVLVGGMVAGDSAEAFLNRYGGLVLSVVPDRPEQRPASEYLEWHARAVFRAA